MTIEEGDGTMAKRLALGCCPNCNTALPKEPRSECRVCGLKIGSSEAQDEKDRPVVVRMKGVWK